MKPQDFIVQYDENDPAQFGRPKHFNPEDLCDLVEQYLTADEVKFALHLLENPPAFYRAYPTERMKQLKADIYKHTWNMTNYIEDKDERHDESLKIQARLNPQVDFPHLGVMIDIPFCFPRGPVMIETIKEYNDKGIVPFIWEMGPANFWLPHGLKHKGLKFNYFATSLNKTALNDHKERLKDVWLEKPLPNQPQIFVCFEVIEHLWQETDILHQYNIYGADAEIILISTPLHTLLGGMNDWRRDLGHLRTFTIDELVQSASTLFPGYHWTSYPYQMQVVKGVRK